MIKLLILFGLSAMMATRPQAGIVLTGSVTDNVASLHWENTTSFVIKSYTIRKKVNAGNLKNAFITIAVLDASVMDLSVPMTNSKNTFLVAALTIDGYGLPSNELNLH